MVLEFYSCTEYPVPWYWVSSTMVLKFNFNTKYPVLWYWVSSTMVLEFNFSTLVLYNCFQVSSTMVLEFNSSTLVLDNDFQVSSTMVLDIICSTLVLEKNNNTNTSSNRKKKYFILQICISITKTTKPTFFNLCSIYHLYYLIKLQFFYLKIFLLILKKHQFGIFKVWIFFFLHYVWNSSSINVTR